MKTNKDSDFIYFPFFAKSLLWMENSAAFFSVSVPRSGDKLRKLLGNVVRVLEDEFNCLFISESDAMVIVGLFGGNGGGSTWSHLLYYGDGLGIGYSSVT